MCCLSATETISSPWQTLDPGSKLHFVALAPLFPAVHASALLSTTKDPHFPLGIPSLQLTWQRSLQKGMNLSGTSPQVPSWRKGTFSVFHVLAGPCLLSRARVSHVALPKPRSGRVTNTGQQKYSKVPRHLVTAVVYLGRGIPCNEALVG